MIEPLSTGPPDRGESRARGGWLNIFQEEGGQITAPPWLALGSAISDFRRDGLETLGAAGPATPLQRNLPVLSVYAFPFPPFPPPPRSASGIKCRLVDDLGENSRPLVLEATL